MKKEKQNRKETKKEQDIDVKSVEKTNKIRYAFIYTFMCIMLIVIAVLLYIIFGERFSLGYKNPIVTIDLEDYGVIKAELYPSKAPNTVNNFISLIESGYYNNKVVYGVDAVSIHFGRNQRGEFVEATTSMINKSIEEDSELDFVYEIDGEFESNNFKGNDIKHEKYTLSLVRADYSDLPAGIIMPDIYSYNSGSSMFKILFDDAPGMNGNYAAFGKVIEGEEIIDSLAKRKLRFNIETEEEREELNEFYEFVNIKSIKVETFGRPIKDIKLHKQYGLDDYIKELFENRI